MPTPIRLLLGLVLVVALAFPSMAQVPSPDMIEFLTADWTGERDDTGRPLVPDAILDRMLNVSIEEAWGVLRRHGYHNQFDGGWEMLHDDRPFVGRALTAQYMPLRPNLNERILERGHAEGRIGASNSWPIDMLQERDVYVADGYGKIIDGTLIGDNLGNSIYANSGTGVVFDASARDIEGLAEIDGFNAFVRGWDPSFLTGTMLTEINAPIRIGRVTVLPGDVVLAKREGVIFVPPHLAEEVVVSSELVSLRDTFGHARLREGTYTPGEIDGAWSDEIKADFLSWVDDNPELMSMSKDELVRQLEARGW